MKKYYHTKQKTTLIHGQGPSLLSPNYPREEDVRVSLPAILKNNNKLIVDDESIQSFDEVNLETLGTPNIELRNKKDKKEPKLLKKEDLILDRPAPKDTTSKLKHKRKKPSDQ